MPRNAGGAFTTPPGSDAVSLASISSAAYNAFLDDIESELTDSWSRSGKGAALANLSMGSHKLTDLAAAVDPGDAVRLSQLTGLYQPVDATLTALAAFSTLGLLTLTAADTFAGRSIAVAGTGLSVTNPAGTAGNPTITIDPAAVIAAAGGEVRGRLWGLTLANNATDATNDIDIAVGEAASDVTPFYRMILAAALTKRLDAAWAVGTGQGGLDTGAIANTTYHVFLIRRSDTGVVDALFSASPTAPTMPASYDQKRRIGSIVRSAAAIVAFTQIDDTFYLTPVNVLNTTGVTATAVTVTLPTPLGLALEALLSVSLMPNFGTPNLRLLVTALAQVDTLPTATVFDIDDNNNAPANIHKRVHTNTSGQVRYRASTTDASATIKATLFGWIDRRGVSA